MTVPWVQFDDLNIPAVAGIISATMTEIDPPDERNVIVKMGGVTDKDHLLMVRSSSAHPLIEKDFTARLVHLDGEASILFRIKPESITMRTPEQTSDVDTSSTRVGQEGLY
jgi:hypothetical protein